jgi:tetratricopeptide (TPR) repeat protein
MALWPAGLANYYPRPLQDPGWGGAALAAVLLAAITATAVRQRRCRPWLLAGWAWYLATLLPMIGIVQAGAQARADRYTYLTLTGFFVALAWEARALLRRRPALAPAAAAVASGALVVLALLTQRQIGYWTDTVTLSRRALAVTRDNWFVENNLGAALVIRGEHAEAIDLFRDVLRRRPDDVYALNNLGTALFRMGRFSEALRWVSRARDLAPDNPEVRRNYDAVRAACLATMDSRRGAFPRR